MNLKYWAAVIATAAVTSICTYSIDALIKRYQTKPLSELLGGSEVVSVEVGDRVFKVTPDALAVFKSHYVEMIAAGAKFNPYKQQLFFASADANGDKLIDCSEMSALCENTMDPNSLIGRLATDKRSFPRSGSREQQWAYLNNTLGTQYKNIWMFHLDINNDDFGNDDEVNRAFCLVRESLGK